MFYEDKSTVEMTIYKNAEVKRIINYILDEKNDPAHNHIFKLIKHGQGSRTRYNIPNESVLCIVYLSLPDLFFDETYGNSERDFFTDNLKFNLVKLSKLANSDITKHLEHFNKIILYCQSLLNNSDLTNLEEDEPEHKFVIKCRRMLTLDMIQSNELTLKKFLSLHKTQYLDFLSTEFMLELYVNKDMTTYISTFEDVLPKIIENDRFLTEINSSFLKNKFSNSSDKKNKLYNSLKNCKDEVKIIPLSYEDSFITIFRLLHVHTLLIKQVSILFNKEKRPKMSELIEQIEKIYIFSQYIIECQTLIFDDEIQKKYYKYINNSKYAAFFRELNKTSFAIINLLFNGVTEPHIVKFTDQNNKEKQQEIYFYLFKKQSKGMLSTKLQDPLFSNFLVDFKKVDTQFNYDIKKMIQ